MLAQHHPVLRAVEVGRLPAAASGSDTPVVTLRCASIRTARLAATPQVSNPQITPYFLAAADSAMRAVQAMPALPSAAGQVRAVERHHLDFDPQSDMF